MIVTLQKRNNRVDTLVLNMHVSYTAWLAVNTDLACSLAWQSQQLDKSLMIKDNHSSPSVGSAGGFCIASGWSSGSSTEGGSGGCTASFAASEASIQISPLLDSVAGMAVARSTGAESSCCPLPNALLCSSAALAGLSASGSSAGVVTAGSDALHKSEPCLKIVGSHAATERGHRCSAQTGFSTSLAGFDCMTCESCRRRFFYSFKLQAVCKRERNTPDKVVEAPLENIMEFIEAFLGHSRMV